MYLHDISKAPNSLHLMHLLQQDQDNLVHLTWTERLPDGGALYSDGKLVEPEVECIVMPGTSATFELIQGRRVWVMKYEEQQYFFW